mmetsp:Transcript_16281/g.52103  ORF Transcript_16281/g.52103 Transcript_16281/m.52103 type:complete len:154 (-) Transcript_16281:26-487(-)
MGYELEALQGGSRWLLADAPGHTGGVAPERRPTLVCSVLLDELPLRGGREDVRRLGAILRLLREGGFEVEAFLREHRDGAAQAKHRVLVERLQPGSLGRLAAGVRSKTARELEGLGFVVAGWRSRSECAPVASSFRPQFSQEDFGPVLRQSGL